jgi:hypothetical protein
MSTSIEALTFSLFFPLQNLYPNQLASRYPKEVGLSYLLCLIKMILRIIKFGLHPFHFHDCLGILKLLFKFYQFLFNIISFYLEIRYSIHTRLAKNYCSRCLRIESIEIIRVYMLPSFRGHFLEWINFRNAPFLLHAKILHSKCNLKDFKITYLLINALR